MKLTKNTNAVRIESPKFHQPEVYRLIGVDWVSDLPPRLKRSQKQMQAFLDHSDKQGYQIYDMSEDLL